MCESIRVTIPQQRADDVQHTSMNKALERVVHLVSNVYESISINATWIGAVPSIGASSAMRIRSIQNYGNRGQKKTVSSNVNSLNYPILFMNRFYFLWTVYGLICGIIDKTKRRPTNISSFVRSSCFVDWHKKCFCRKRKECVCVRVCAFVESGAAVLNR